MSESDYRHSHCKGCDKMFFPTWKGKDLGFEDLCPQCLNVAMNAARSSFDWMPEDELRTVVGDWKRSSMADLLGDDEYHKYGSDVFGDPGQWEKV